MQTPQLDQLQHLQAQGLLVTAPPKDDDDAYVLTIARREHARARQQSSYYQFHQQHYGMSGFVLSNDMFRDAIARDTTTDGGEQQQPQLAMWLNQGRPGAVSSSTSSAATTTTIAFYPGRFPYAFGDMGFVDEYGDPELDIIPNPKHPIVMQIESTRLQQHNITSNNRVSPVSSF